MKPQKFDIVVVGGGMVGSVTAVALAQRGLQVALIEKHIPASFSPNQPPDLRVSAISLASKNLLHEIGLWSAIADMRVHPYQRIEVWEEDGYCAFSADQLRRPELGFFVENRLIQLAALEQSSQLKNLLVFDGKTVEELSMQDKCQLVLSDGKHIICDWVVAADGARSRLRELAGIKTTGWKYSQQVLGVSVKMHDSSGESSWQRFSPSGPMALLPMYDDHASLIWYNSAKEVARLKELSLEDLKEEIVSAFPERLGDFTIVARASFPIQRLHARRYTRDRLLLIGDAAHCINPLAGQGVNLGFKDLAALLSLYDQSGHLKEFELKTLFSKYERARRYDNLAMMSAMDAFYLSFSNNSKLVKQLRNTALKFANISSPMKIGVLKHAVGVS